MIAISYDEHWERKSLGTIIVLAITLLCWRKIFGPSQQLGKVFYTMIVIAMLLNRAFVAISEFGQEKVKRNKLENIIFSNRDFWTDAICWGLILPIVMKTNLKLNFFTVIGFIAVIVIAYSKVSKKVSNFFKKRLVE